MANAFSYNAIDFAGATYGLQLEAYEEAMSPDADFVVAETGGQAKRIGSAGYKSGTMTLNCVVTGSTTTDLIDKCDAIMRVLNTAKGSKQLILDDLNTRYWTAMAINGIQRPQLGTLHTKFPLIFQLEGPAKAVTATAPVAEAIASDPDTFTITSPSGSDYANVVIYLRNETAATVASVILENTTTGEQIRWTGSLLDDFWIRFGSEDADGRYLYTCDTSTTGGADPTILAWSNVKTGIGTTGGDWPRLEPGTNNTISVTGISAGQFQYSYRATYIGG